MKEINNKFYMEAKIDLVEETEALRKEVSSVIKLPDKSNKQPDLQYFSALFVSSGTNLNLAHFLPSELVLASGSITSKAVDVEHEEADIIGHIYDYAFVDADGNKLDVQELASMEKASLDTSDMHILIAGIIYKSRFPNIAKEVSDNQWKVSMEAYYQSYDVKIGNLILDKKEADLLGFPTEKSTAFGTMVKVVKKGVEIASGKAARVLRGICFSGVGIVKNPANPPSVILETATQKDNAVTNQDEPLILDYDKVTEIANNVTSSNIEDEKTIEDVKEKSELVYTDTIGICVNYKKRLIDSITQDQNSNVLKENWCTAYDQQCTSFSRDTSDPDCLRHQIPALATACVNDLLNKKEAEAKRSQLIDDLLKKVNKAKQGLY
ncbi:MAG TPA: hypothetical protein VI911_08110 [Patescibacteria group bacterium]|nr:hypothetical protein [Patescibacteria group bacterium]